MKIQWYKNQRFAPVCKAVQNRPPTIFNHEELSFVIHHVHGYSHKMIIFAYSTLWPKWFTEYRLLRHFLPSALHACM